MVYGIVSLELWHGIVVSSFRSFLVPCFLVCIFPRCTVPSVAVSFRELYISFLPLSFFSAFEILCLFLCPLLQEKKPPSNPIQASRIHIPQTSSSSSSSSLSTSSCLTTTFCFLAGPSSSPSSSPCSSCSACSSSLLSSSRTLFLPLVLLPLPFAAAVATLAFLPPLFLAVAVVVVVAEEDSFLIWSLTARRVGASPRVVVANVGIQ